MIPVCSFSHKSPYRYVTKHSNHDDINMYISAVFLTSAVQDLYLCRTTKYHKFLLLKCDTVYLTRIFSLPSRTKLRIRKIYFVPECTENNHNNHQLQHLDTVTHFSLGHRIKVGRLLMSAWIISAKFVYGPLNE
jgi:hypothetical protein